MRASKPKRAAGGAKRAPPAWRRSLVADSDAAIGRLLKRDLATEGFGVQLERTGRAVLDCVTDQRPDAVILGSDLPDMTAIDLIGQLGRRSPPPVLVLVEADAHNIARLLDAGADDCMRKPFYVGELAARLRKLVRYYLQAQGLPASIRTGALELDCVLWRARLGGENVILSVRERTALRMLVEDIGKVVSNADLLARLWDCAPPSQKGRVGPVIRNLRRKLELSSQDRVQLMAVPQVGYRLVVSTKGQWPS